VRFLNPEHRSLFLLLSVLTFIVLTAFLENSRAGEFLLVVSTYLTLVAATMELSERRLVFWTALPLAGISMILLLVSHLAFYQNRPIQLASDLVLAVFLGMVSVSLFTYLGRPGAITAGRLYVSVSLYFLMGLSWYVFYQLVNFFQPGSFAEAGKPLLGRVAPSKMIYFSLATLTTLGYGDLVAIRPPARILAALEAAAGVLYIAITVARLVASYQRPLRREETVPGGTRP